MADKRSGGFLAEAELSHNPIEQARQKRMEAGLPIIDLTSSNPTHHGLLFPAAVLSEASANYFARRSYDPDPQGLLSAREAIVDYYSRRIPKLKLTPAHIFITAGTSESYAQLFSLLCQAGDEVLGPKVTYPLFEMLAEHARLHYTGYHIGEASSCIDDQHFKTLLQPNSRVLMFISPHNPLGRIANSVSRAVCESALPIICDEVFADFPFAMNSVPPLGTLYQEQAVFHLNGISKMFALPDLKLGWIALNQRALDEYGERLAFLNDAFLSCSTLVQAMLPEIFWRGEEFQRTLQERVRNNLKLALDMLSQCSAVHCSAPEGGSFLFFEVETPLDEDELVLKLIEHGVYVHPGYFYGADSGVHLMVSCIIEPEKLEKGLELLLGCL